MNEKKDNIRKFQSPSRVQTDKRIIIKIIAIVVVAASIFYGLLYLAEL